MDARRQPLPAHRSRCRSELAPECPAGRGAGVAAPENGGQVAAGAGRTPAGEPGRPTPYHRDPYARLRRFVLIATAIAGGFALLVTLITYAVSANSLRAVVLSRREE